MRALLGAVLLGGACAGVDFSRSITSVANDSSFYIELSSGCSSSDEYGSNNCKLEWGQSLDTSITGKLGHPLDEGSSFIVDLKVDTIIPWKFSCALCGANCTTSVPIVETSLNFEMPSCPIAAGELERTIERSLPAESPTKGVKVTAEGSVVVKDDSGAEVVAAKVHMKLK